MSHIEPVMATFFAISQPPPKRFDDKFAMLTAQLRLVEEEQREAFYLLATYCFDLSRKLEYLTQVTRPFAEFISPGLAHEILEDTEAINASGLTWQTRAEVAHGIMMRLYHQSGNTQLELLTEAANQVGQQT